MYNFTHPAGSSVCCLLPGAGVNAVQWEMFFQRKADDDMVHGLLQFKWKKCFLLQAVYDAPTRSADQIAYLRVISVEIGGRDGIKA